MQEVNFEARNIIQDNTEEKNNRNEKNRTERS